MQMWRYLRIVAFSLVAVSPILLQTGCGDGGGGEDDSGAVLSPEEDESLDPDSDSTMIDADGGDEGTEGTEGTEAAADPAP